MSDGSLLAVSEVKGLLVSVSEPTLPSMTACSADTSAVSRSGSFSIDDIRIERCELLYLMYGELLVC